MQRPLKQNKILSRVFFLFFSPRGSLVPPCPRALLDPSSRATLPHHSCLCRLGKQPPKQPYIPNNMLNWKTKKNWTRSRPQNYWSPFNNNITTIVYERPKPLRRPERSTADDCAKTSMPRRGTCWNSIQKKAHSHPHQYQHPHRQRRTPKQMNWAGTVAWTKKTKTRTKRTGTITTRTRRSWPCSEERTGHVEGKANPEGNDEPR